MKKWMLVFSALSVAMSALLSSRLARAAEVCDTVETCQALQVKVNARLEVLLKNVAPRLTDVARDADGRVLIMTQYAADNYCRNEGLRLPTARELALYSRTLGADGISETEKEGYYLVKGSDSVGNPDNFYFNCSGFKYPIGELGKYWIWSSSVTPDSSDFAYYLAGYNGCVGYSPRANFESLYGTARCVHSR